MDREKTMKKWAKTWIGNIREFSKGIKDEHVAAYAGQSAFFIFLSIFPLIHILLLLTAVLPISEEALVETLTEVFPEDLSGLVKNMVSDIYTGGATTLTIVSVVVGLWSSSKGIMAIRNGLNEVYRSRDQRNFLITRLISVLYTAIFVIFLLLYTSVSIFGRQIAEGIGRKYENLKGLSDFLVSIRGIVSFAIAFLLILLMYTELPRRKLLMRCQVPGALFTAGAWSLISWGFSYYVEYTMQKSQMYGSLATIIIFLFWIYLMVNIIFMGGQLNSFLYLYVYKEKVEEIKAKKMAKRAAKKSGKLGYWLDRFRGKTVEDMNWDPDKKKETVREEQEEPKEQEIREEHETEM